MSDPVRPAHYRGHPSGVECIEFAELFPFSLGNAVKYLWRAGEKGEALTDLKKALWYLDRDASGSGPAGPHWRRNARTILGLKMARGLDPAAIVEGFGDFRREVFALLIAAVERLDPDALLQARALVEREVMRLSVQAGEG